MKIILVLLLATQAFAVGKVRPLENHYTFRRDIIPLISHLPEMTSIILPTTNYDDLNGVELMMMADHLHIHLLVQPHFVYFDGTNLKARPLLLEHGIMKAQSEWTGPPHRLVVPPPKYIWPYETFDRLPVKDQERITDLAEKLRVCRETGDLKCLEKVLRLFDNPQ